MPHHTSHPALFCPILYFDNIICSDGCQLPTLTCLYYVYKALLCIQVYGGPITYIDDITVKAPICTNDATQAAKLIKCSQRIGKCFSDLYDLNQATIEKATSTYIGPLSADMNIDIKNCSISFENITLPVSLCS